MIQIEKFIASIRGSFIGAEQVYMNGSCILFYKILKTVYPNAKPYWSNEGKHMITRIGNKYYDITGEVKNTEGYSLDEGSYTSLPTAVAFPDDKEQRVRTADSKKLY